MVKKFSKLFHVDVKPLSVIKLWAFQRTILSNLVPMVICIETSHFDLNDTFYLIDCTLSYSGMSHKFFSYLVQSLDSLLSLSHNLGLQTHLPDFKGHILALFLSQ